MRALQESGQFSVLTANVAGLPAIFSSANPKADTPEIGKQLRNYDIVNVQEDFAYHDTLYANDNHPYRTVTSGNVPKGSGLNTLSSFPFAGTTAIQRVQWNKCSNFDYFDCLTRKGFSLIQIELADGVSVDVYNIHADAGNTKADLAARTNNANQVIDYIVANSNGQAVLVFGDTNALYTDARDNVRDFLTRANLTDAWVSKIRQENPPAAGSSALSCHLEETTNDCEVIDKIFFRGNNLLNLELVRYNVETAAFAKADGKQLSDHVPVSSVFTWSLSANLRQSSAVGGVGGSAFTDVNAVSTGRNVTSVTVRGGARVDAVSITVGDATFRHGGAGGADQTLTLNDGEYLQSVEIHTGEFNRHIQVFYVKVTTSTERSIASGTPTDNRVVHTAPVGFQIAGFHGRSGVEVDALGVVFTRL